MSLTIAGLQHPGHPGDVQRNLQVLTDAAAEARERGAELLVTPEMFVTGYNIGDRVAELADQPLAAAVSRIAADTGMAIVAGLPERLPGGGAVGLLGAGESVGLLGAGESVGLLGAGESGVANTALFVDDHGIELARYRKTHLFADLDRELFVAGDSLGKPVSYRGVSIALLICYDVEFPETVRAAALAGADVVIVPTAQMEPYAFLAERLIPIRAWESQIYVVYVNHSGTEGDLTYVGRSSIAAPSGEVLDAMDPSASAGIVLATVDPDVVARARVANPYLDDLRPELY